MAQIIWDGNKNWENVWDGKQPWDREIEEKSIPENAVLIDRPDDIIKASIPYMIIPCIVCFVAIFTKKAQSDEFIFNLWFMPLSFIIGFFVAMPLHEFLQSLCPTAAYRPKRFPSFYCHPILSAPRDLYV